MGLPFGGQLAQAVEVPLDLVDDFAAGAGIVGGEEVGVALRVVGRGETAYGAIDATAQGGDGIGGLATQNIIGGGVDRTVAVSHGQRLTQRIDGQHILG